jgi:pimeloyl-ACP methyl ester carboxylesterase
VTATTTVFPAAGSRTHGVAMIAPGLNNRPEAMEPLIEVLTANGYGCVRTTFEFGERLEPDAVAQKWIAGVAEAHALAEQRCGKGRACAVAYSLGAAVTLAFLRRMPAAFVARMFLVAPPLALTKPAALIRALMPLRRFGMALPSLAPTAIRARSSTTLTDYHALLSLIDEVSQPEIAANVRAASTKILVSDRDELVDCAGVREWVASRRLDWPVQVIHTAPPRSMRHHLLLSESTMGPDAWQLLTTELLRHLSASI